MVVVVVLVIERSETGVMVATAVLLSFSGFESVVPELTVAVFVMVPGTEGAVAAMVIGFAAPTASVGIVQVTVPAAWPQVQPVPLAETNVTPAGRGSVTVTLDADPGPLFVTASV